jgi:hypothetical protein
VLFSRSTDHGVTFSRPEKVTPVEVGTASFTDLAVGPDGAVYLTFITYPSSSRPTWDIWLSKSTDQGRSFGPARHVDTITAFDSDQFSQNGFVDCGDGPFACELVLAGGRRVPLGTFSLRAYQTGWGRTIPVSLHEVARVELRDLGHGRTFQARPRSA